MFNVVNKSELVHNGSVRFGKKAFHYNYVRLSEGSSNNQTCCAVSQPVNLCVTLDRIWEFGQEILKNECVIFAYCC